MVLCLSSKLREDIVGGGSYRLSKACRGQLHHELLSRVNNLSNLSFHHGLSSSYTLYDFFYSFWSVHRAISVKKTKWTKPSSIHITLRPLPSTFFFFSFFLLFFFFFFYQKFPFTSHFFNLNISPFKIFFIWASLFQNFHSFNLPCFIPPIRRLKFLIPSVLLNFLKIFFKVFFIFLKILLITINFQVWFFPKINYFTVISSFQFFTVT